MNEQEKPENIPSQSELLEMRMDEKAVLESIYDSNFKVKDNTIWSVKLNMDYLTKLYENSNPENVKRKELTNHNANFKTKKKEACKLFLRGSCRFGAKCKFLHESPLENKKSNEVENKDSEKVFYELEIRFPDDTLYPYQAPLLYFKLGHKTDLIPALTCLRITARLYEEAKTLAQDGIPSIYSLVELLSNEEDIVNYIKFDTRKFPEPSDALFPQLIENSEVKEKELPSHYKKGDGRGNRSNVNMEEVLKENSEIAKRFMEKRENNRYNRMMSDRRKLPAWKKKQEILDAMKKSQVNYCFIYFFFFYESNN